MKTFLFLFALNLPLLTAATNPQKMSVEKHGFNGQWYPVEKSDAPFLILLGGSEGGHTFGSHIAPWLNNSGYHVLSMAYFKADGLPDQLEEIPLEYLDKAIAWLDTQNDKESNNFGLIGVSKGAELALLQATRIDRFSAVVAISPTSVVWQSINQQDFTSVKSSWTLGGDPIAYMPYCLDRGYGNIFDFYDCAFDSPSDEDVFIPVERINAPILLLSGGDDKLWPSERMALMLVDRLESKNFAHEISQINYPEAGHWLLAPYLDRNKEHPLLQDQRMFDFLGGSPDELLEITARAESAILEFFKQHSN